MTKWPGVAQFGLKRKIYDHVAILLKEEVSYWGPKPFKFVNGWLKEKGCREMVEQEWKAFNVKGLEWFRTEREA